VCVCVSHMSEKMTWNIGGTTMITAPHVHVYVHMYVCICEYI
jgi:hypothetical protein